MPRRRTREPEWRGPLPGAGHLVPRSEMKHSRYTTTGSTASSWPTTMRSTARGGNAFKARGAGGIMAEGTTAAVSAGNPGDGAFAEPDNRSRSANKVQNRPAGHAEQRCDTANRIDERSTGGQHHA
jgi:hypothetical protein